MGVVIQVVKAKLNALVLRKKTTFNCDTQNKLQNNSQIIVSNTVLSGTNN
jgi:hypothetical protein